MPLLVFLFLYPPSERSETGEILCVLSVCAHAEAMIKEERLGPLRVYAPTGHRTRDHPICQPTPYRWHHHGMVYVTAFIGLHILKGKSRYICGGFVIQQVYYICQVNEVKLVDILFSLSVCTLSPLYNSRVCCCNATVAPRSECK